MKKLLIFMLLLNGCAYIVNGDTQSIFLKTSDNKRVKAVVKNDKMETTYMLPTTVTVPKSKNDLVITTVGTECITPTKTTVQSQVDGWVFGNVATLGLGLIKDSQGAMWKYDESYTVNVKRDNKCIKQAKELNDIMLNLHM